MSREEKLLLLLGAAVLGWLYVNRSSVQNVGIATEAAVLGWKNVQQGPVWVPVLNQTEAALGIPTDLLARIAYEESHFRPDIISGATVSSAGALGLMQLEPQYFSSVQVPRPFSSSDTTAQITQAGAELARLYGVYSDWSLAVAAYNDGEGNVDAYLAGTRPLPAATSSYVADITADVPVPGTLSA